ncbi:ketopantoate reductase family protein [Paenibacillus glycanilyticus]|uniref:2-dehydropantoate 2-reductase n=1 Tax=Paenibacillus glycanilyticus TaxID=126569 RepID=A0ABQ6GBI8_9BACL|nr:2-dehydropantoate 2-reductase [Paenibacillus glycanilyticus]GLX68248.1 2-dehydropantoate 2-reductase [Paenibacillus glycanilyticus]
MNNLKIHIVGGGAIGLLHAARLALSGTDVTVWTRTGEQAERLRKEGIRLVTLEGEERDVQVQSQSIDSLQGQDVVGSSSAWVILTVKQSHIHDGLLQRLKGSLIQKNTAVLCLQNGIGHMDKMEGYFPDIPLYTGVTSVGARRLDPRSVRHTGDGPLWFGPHRADKRSENLQNLLLNILKSAGFRAGLSNEMRDRIYQKLLVNAVINPLTAIFDTTNGELPKHPSRLKLMRSLYEESFAVLSADGMTLEEDGWRLVLQVCEATAANVSSMLSDVRAGRKTEIDWINGGLSELARRLGLPSPLNDAAVAFVKQIHS